MVGNKLVDAPGTGDGHQLLGGGDVGGHGAGVDVEHAAGHGGALRQTGELGGLGVDLAAQVIGIADGGQHVKGLADAQLLQNGAVKPGVLHVHQTGAGDVGGLAEGLAGETEADVVLYGEDVLDVVIDLRQVILEPGQQSGLLAGHELLTQLGVQRFISAVLIPLFRVLPGPIVGGDDAVVGGLVVLAPGVHALAVAAHRDAQNVLAVDPGLLQGLPHAGAVGQPELLHVPLGITGLGGNELGVAASSGHLVAVYVENRGLGRGAAVIQSDQIHITNTPVITAPPEGRAVVVRRFRYKIIL